MDKIGEIIRIIKRYEWGQHFDACKLVLDILNVFSEQKY